MNSFVIMIVGLDAVSFFRFDGIRTISFGCKLSDYGDH